MTLQLKLKNSLLANSSYNSSFLDFLQKVALWEGNRGGCVNLECVSESVWFGRLATPRYE